MVENKDEVKTLKDHLRSDEFKESGLKFVIGSIVIPLIGAVALFLNAWLESSILNWSIFVITLNVIMIPAFKAWLSKEFGIKETALQEGLNDIEVIYEKKIVVLKEDHMDEVITLKDEINALKITNHLQKYQLENPMIKTDTIKPIITDEKDDNPYT